MNTVIYLSAADYEQTEGRWPQSGMISGNWDVLVYGLFIRIATPLAFSAIVSSQDVAIAGLLGRWSWQTKNKEYYT